jgi:hypothetical protein
LKTIAYQKKIIVIVLNNVVSDMQGEDRKDHHGEDGGPGESRFKKNSSSVPALGMLWSTCINDRIGLKKFQHSSDMIQRKITIDLSSHMKKEEMEFEITSSGI